MHKGSKTSLGSISFTHARPGVNSADMSEGASLRLRGETEDLEG